METNDLQKMKKTAQRIARELLYESTGSGNPDREGFYYQFNSKYVATYVRSTASILRGMIVASAIRSLGDQSVHNLNVSKEGKNSDAD